MTESRNISPEEMNRYVVRFGDQPSVRQRAIEVLKLPVPPALFGKLFAYDLFNLVGKTKSPADAFAVEGPKDTSIFVARMPPKFGPTYLHIHKNTWETFFVISGQFKVTFGDEGQHSVVLNPYDTIAVPPMVVRNFENLSDQTGDLLVVIAGAEDATELFYTKAVKDEIEGIGGKQVMAVLDKVGLRFME